jgi:hypothetical protein
MLALLVAIVLPARQVGELVAVAAQPAVDQFMAFPADARRAFDDADIEHGNFLGESWICSTEAARRCLPRRKDESRGCRSAGAQRNAIGDFGQSACIRKTGRTKNSG